MKRRLKNSKGFLIIEVIMVIFIISISMWAIMSVAQKSIQLSQRSLHSNQATFLLEEGAEATRMIRDATWSNISSLTVNTDYYLSFSGNTWTLTSNPEILGNFSRRIRFSNVNRNTTTGSISSSGSVDAGTKLVSIYVDWFEGGNSTSRVLEFYLSDIFS
jgi:Tfp pilus assembly protein PilV